MTLTGSQKPPALYRWSVLVFISLAMFGNYYIYDSISPLADVLKTQLSFSDKNIGLLNAIYSIPNIFMVLLGGFIIDRIGTRKGSILFSILCMIGAVITVLKGNVAVMATGRLIFGLGAESLIVAITTVIAKWFKGKELSFAFGLNLTIARLGSFMALNSPTIFQSYYQSWQKPLLVSVGAGVISVLSVLIYFALEHVAENKYTLGESEDVDVVKWNDILRLNPAFWYITLLCVTFYSAVFPFQTFAVKFFIESHFTELSEITGRSLGGFLSSLLTLASMIMTPLFGLLADKIGKRARLMMIGSVLLIPVYLVMNYVKLDAALPESMIRNIQLTASDADIGFFAAFWSKIEYFAFMIKVLVVYYPNLLLAMGMMGLAFSLVPAVMWPSVALIVKQGRLGTAYGLMTMVQNIGLAGFNLLIGFANDFSGGYTMGMWIFSVLGFLGMLFAYLLMRADRIHLDGHLAKPAFEQDVL